MALEGFHKLLEEFGEAAADGNKLQGKALEGLQADADAMLPLFLAEVGDSWAAIQYFHRKLTKAQRKLVAAARDEKLKRHRKRKLPGLATPQAAIPEKKKKK